MSNFLRKPWICTALVNASQKVPNSSVLLHPAAQIIEFKALPDMNHRGTSKYSAQCLVSDKCNFVKASLTNNALSLFESENDHLSLKEMVGCLIVIKKYQVLAVNNFSEFIIEIDHFDYIGCEGSCTYSYNNLGRQGVENALFEEKVKVSLRHLYNTNFSNTKLSYSECA
eukprot:Sdes_comp10805_c0_seq1m2468